MNVQGRRILVTGAASGIGRAATERLLEYGARVATIDIAPLPPEIEQGAACRHWQADISDDAAVERAVSEAAF